MRKVQKINHTFVDAIPDVLEDGVLYVCIQYGTVVHKCFCGCQNEVVTPLTPTDWRLTFNGETVSLYPSIGSWSLKCRSHYWIKNDQVDWADEWSDYQVRANSDQDRRIKKAHYGNGAAKDKRPMSTVQVERQDVPSERKQTFWEQIRSLLRD